MKKSKNVVLYETITFPVWLLMFIPRAWLIIIPGLFIINSVFLLGLLWRFKKGGRKNLELTPELRGELFDSWKKCIFPVWIISFISCILSAGMLMMFTYIPGILSGEDSWWSRNVARAISENPLSNFFAVIVTLCCIAFAVYITYNLNRRVSFRKLALYDDELKRFSMWFSILTAPYVLLLPSVIFWG